MAENGVVLPQSAAKAGDNVREGDANFLCAIAVRSIHCVRNDTTVYTVIPFDFHPLQSHFAYTCIVVDDFFLAHFTDQMILFHFMK